VAASFSPPKMAVANNFSLREDGGAFDMTQVAASFSRK